MIPDETVMDGFSPLKVLLVYREGFAFRVSADTTSGLLLSKILSAMVLIPVLTYRSYPDCPLKFDSVTLGDPEET